MLLELNKPLIPNLTANAKLMAGTAMTLPPRGAGECSAPVQVGIRTAVVFLTRLCWLYMRRVV
jgi:hypothetical protein